MPKCDPTPKALRPYAHHGVNFSYPSNDEAVAECPFCGKAKFYASCETSKASCKVCIWEGNSTDFLGELHTRSMAATTDYEWIERHRGLSASAMRRWGVCQSVITSEWLVPGYGVSGKVNNLYRYVKAEGYSLQGTWECPVTVFHPTGSPPDKGTVLVTEGAWDGIALWDRIRKVKPDGGPYSVVAVPGVTSLSPKWCEYLSGRDVVILFDNDHPMERGGRVIKPGYDGTKWTTGALASQEEPPKSISYLWWGDEGYDKNQPDGCDVRDLLATGPGPAPLTEMLFRIRPVPTEWTDGKCTKRGSGTADPIKPEKCESFEQLRDVWRDAMKWTPGLDGALICMLASIASVKAQGEQSWFKIVGPPSCGKSTLCEAVAVARKYVYSDSKMKGMYSHYREDKEGTEDFSLAAKLFDKTLVLKDADTLIRNPNKDEILSDWRDLYDMMGRASSKIGITREYQGLRFTIILCGTETIRELDTSECGQRFLDWEVMGRIDAELEDDIVQRAIQKEIRASMTMSNCKLETTLEERYLRAMKYTGGYIEYLRKHGEHLAQGVTFPQESADRCGKLARFVSYMRARPSEVHESGGGRELSARLAKQLVRLCRWAGVVMQTTEVDYRVMGIINKVALDTARGRTLDIVKALAESGTVGMDLREVSRATGKLTHKEASYMQFLTNIEALEQFDDGLPSLSRTARWRLTEPFSRLYRSVMGTTNKVGV